MRLYRWEPALLVIATIISVGLAHADVDHAVRTLATLIYIAVAPGVAALRLIGLNDPVTRALLTVPVSLCLAAVVSAAMVYFGWTQWDFAHWVLISVTLGAATLSIARPTFVPPLSEQLVTGKLGDRERQEGLLEALRNGASMREAAAAAGVSVSTVRGAAQRSPILANAIRVASRDVIGVRPIRSPRSLRQATRRSVDSGGSVE